MPRRPIYSMLAVMWSGGGARTTQLAGRPHGSTTWGWAPMRSKVWVNPWSSQYSCTQMHFYRHAHGHLSFTFSLFIERAHELSAPLPAPAGLAARPGWDCSAVTGSPYELRERRVWTAATDLICGLVGPCDGGALRGARASGAASPQYFRHSMLAPSGAVAAKRAAMRGTNLVT